MQPNKLINFKKPKRQTTEWENITTTQNSSERLVAGIEKRSLKVSQKKADNLILQVAERCQQVLRKVARRETQSFATPSVIREMQ